MNAIDIFKELYELEQLVEKAHPVYVASIRYTTYNVFNFDFWWKEIKEKSFRIESKKDVEVCRDYVLRRIA